MKSHELADMNMSNMNALAFLALLNIPSGDENGLCGSVTIPEARRAIMFARNTFERHVDGLTREDSDTRKPGQCRVIETGIDREYFERRLNDFVNFVEAQAIAGADEISWG